MAATKRTAAQKTTLRLQRGLAHIKMLPNYRKGLSPTQVEATVKILKEATDNVIAKLTSSDAIVGEISIGE